MVSPMPSISSVAMPAVAFTKPPAELVMAAQIKVPIIGFIAGRFVDDMPGVRFGHAATIVEGTRGSTKGKIEMFRKAGIHVAESFSDIADIARRYL